MFIKLKIYNKEGKEVGEEEVPKKLFGLTDNDTLVHQAFTTKLANRRRPYAHVKTRGEVRGGGRKPWRQKGTGRARHGSIRSPIWIGGGVTFGPRNERVFSKKINKKMNRKAMLIVLSSKIRNDNFYLIESLDYKEPKTKLGVGLLSKLGIYGQSAIVYATKEDGNFVRVFRNIPKIKAININRINIVDILNTKTSIFSKSALNHIINNYANTSTHIQKEAERRGKKADTEKADTKKADTKKAAKTDKIPSTTSERSETIGATGTKQKK